nr:helix-turn-helix transcriptional regulator [Marinicella sp. W31]MDC2879331.1 helix-turn-helix transcriptional regulator [Marinicella sp. W31]
MSMTPFGEAVRELRARRGVSQKQMAEAIGVSAAYLSALEHGRRGKPSFDFLQRVAGYFHIIWDDAEALFAIADQSDPRVVVDTAGLSPPIPPLPTGFRASSASSMKKHSENLIC